MGKIISTILRIKLARSECSATETVFVNLLWSPGIDPSLAGRYSNPICRTGPPDYIAWWSRFLGIDAWGSINVYKYGLWTTEADRKMEGKL